MGRHASHGVSVVVPTYRGVGWISRCLDSLAAQTLARDAFEIVVVPNGPDDGTLALLDRYRADHPDLALRVVQIPDVGVAPATNAGLAACRLDFVTFVDDDDRVSPDFVRALLAVADPSVIGVGQVADVGENGQGRPDFDTYINRAVLRWAGKTVDASRCPTALSFNVAKIVSTRAARSVAVDTGLRSGTDLVYWHALVSRHRLPLRIIDPRAHAVYYRSVRAASHSRPAELTYDFGVTQRLETIDRLERDWSGHDASLRRVTCWLVDAQVGHMNRTLAADRSGHLRALEEISAHELPYFPYSRLTRDLARDLVIAYTFLPFADTSALVAARRIRKRGVIVDVVSNDLTGVRPEDPATMALVDGLVDRHIVLRNPANWASWRGIERFCLRGMERIDEAEAAKGHYRSVYSRAMWPASHVLAALYKVRHPDVPWTAEFSDPLLHDVHGTERRVDLPSSEVLDELRAGLLAAGKPLPAEANLFLWIEHLVYALADRVMFTNENQRAYMLDYVADRSLVADIEDRAVVEPQPTLSPEFYSMVRPDYVLEPDLVHIGYFGRFYVTRGLTEIVDALRTLDPQVRRRIRLHVFCDDPGALGHEVADAGLGDVVVVNGYVPYLDFLALTTRFDCLLVNDARTLDTHQVNPYLPSKWSDYVGSGTPIWAVVEDGSVMSGLDPAFVSPLGDAAGARRVLEALAVGRLAGSVQSQVGRSSTARK